jgi:hypothetical protein
VKKVAAGSGYRQDGRMKEKGELQRRGDGPLRWIGGTRGPIHPLKFWLRVRMTDQIIVLDQCFRSMFQINVHSEQAGQLLGVGFDFRRTGEGCNDSGADNHEDESEADHKVMHWSVPLW